MDNFAELSKKPAALTADEKAAKDAMEARSSNEPPPEAERQSCKRKATAKGKAKSKAKGKAKGKSKGKANGKAKGTAKGKAKSKAKAKGKAKGAPEEYDDDFGSCSSPTSSITSSSSSEPSDLLSPTALAQRQRWHAFLAQTEIEDFREFLGEEHKGDIESFSDNSENNREYQGSEIDDDSIVSTEDMSTHSGSTTSSEDRRANAKFDECED